ncbi:MAG: hypothetical protein ACRDIA_05770 [Actinomycetota bacterium]
MAVDERSRHALHSKLEKVLGEVEAVTLMELVPPVGWSEVATKRDLDVLRWDLDALRSDFRVFQDNIKHDFAVFQDNIKHDFAVFQDNIKHDFDGLREQTRNDVGDLRTAFSRDMDDIKSSIGDLRSIVDGHFRTTVFSLLTLFLGFAGVVFVAVRLG